MAHAEVGTYTTLPGGVGVGGWVWVWGGHRTGMRCGGPFMWHDSTIVRHDGNFMWWYMRYNSAIVFHEVVHMRYNRTFVLLSCSGTQAVRQGMSHASMSLDG